MVIEWSDELSAKRSERIVNAPLDARLSCQYRHSLDIPCHRDQRPLALRSRQATQQELPEAHRKRTMFLGEELYRYLSSSALVNLHDRLLSINRQQHLHGKRPIRYCRGGEALRVNIVTHP